MGRACGTYRRNQKESKLHVVNFEKETTTICNRLLRSGIETVFKTKKTVADF
jgi:hypothetical protein